MKLEEASYDPDLVWKPWTVRFNQAAFLLAWLGIFVGVAMASTVSVSIIRITSPSSPPRGLEAEPDAPDQSRDHAAFHDASPSRCRSAKHRTNLDLLFILAQRRRTEGTVGGASRPAECQRSHRGLARPANRCWDGMGGSDRRAPGIGQDYPPAG